MSFNVQKFISRVNDGGGLVQNNKFQLLITPPPILQNSKNYSDTTKTNIANGARSLEFFCASAAIPGVNLNTHEIRRYGYGPMEKRPYSVSFADATFNVYFDAKRKNYDFFQTWMSSIMDYDVNNSTNSKFLLEYKSEYRSTIDLFIYDNSGFLVAHYVMDEAFPISMGDIPLNWADTNSIIKIPVTFTFFTWRNEAIQNNARYEEVSSRVPNIFGEIVKQTNNTSNTAMPAVDQMGNVTGF